MPSKHRRQLSKPKPKLTKQLRTCLSCDETFVSTGPGNRVCPSCTEKHNEQERYRPARADQPMKLFGSEPRGFSCRDDCTGGF